MKNNMSRRDFLRIGAAAALACVALPLTGCGKDTKKLVLGDWYLEGTGKWSIVNDDQLKIADFYGESTVLKIEDIDKDSMTCRQIYDGREDEETITYWHSAEEAEKH